MDKFWTTYWRKKILCSDYKDHYKPNDLIGKKILAVINLKPRQIGNFISEVLVLGVPDMKEKEFF